MGRCVTCDKEGEWSLSNKKDTKKRRRGRNKKKDEDSSFSSPSLLLEEQLNVIFFIENLLDIPEDIVNPTELIERCGDPSEWIQFCDGCREWVEEGREAFRNILRFENILEKCKRNVEKLILQTWKRLEDEDELLFNVAAAIRHSIVRQGSGDFNLHKDKGAVGHQDILWGIKIKEESVDTSNTAEGKDKDGGVDVDEEESCQPDLDAAFDFEIRPDDDENGNKNKDEDADEEQAGNDNEVGIIESTPPVVPTSANTPPVVPNNVNKDYQLNVHGPLVNENVAELEDTLPEDGIICPTCLREFDTPLEMRRHYGGVHKKELEKNCPECGKVFKFPSQMRMHYEAVHRRKVVCRCEKCGRGFAYKDLLKRHACPVSSSAVTYLQTGSDWKQKGKEFCGLPVPSTTDPGQNLMHKCPFCPKVLMVAGDVGRHVKRLHKSWDCQICGDKFDKGIWYRYHVKGHLDEDNQNKYLTGEKICVLLKNDGNIEVLEDEATEPQDQNISINGAVITLQYPCNKQPKAERRRRVKRHVKVKEPQNPTKCPICNKEFENFSKAQFHVKMFHLEEERHEKVACDKCGLLMKKHYMDQHTRLRHAPASVKSLCPICGKTVNVNNLKRHHKLKHDPNTDKQKFRCPCCQKGFAMNFYLLDHQRKYKHFSPTTTTGGNQ